MHAWRSCLEPVAAQHQVLALDLKGFGFSDKPVPAYSISEYPDFVVHLMDAVGLQTATPCGKPIGGNIVWRTVDAYYYPMRTGGAMHAVLAKQRGFRGEIEQWQARIPELNLPTLVTCGAQDMWIAEENADRFNRDIPGSTLVVIPECGHLPQEEKREEFTLPLLDFMTGQGQRTFEERKTDSAPEHHRPTGLTV